MINFCIFAARKKGPLAQLVERVLRMDEVTGSSPVRSTPSLYFPDLNIT